MLTRRIRQWGRGSINSTCRILKGKSMGKFSWENCIQFIWGGMGHCREAPGKQAEPRVQLPLSILLCKPAKSPFPFACLSCFFFPFKSLNQEAWLIMGRWQITLPRRGRLWGDLTTECKASRKQPVLYKRWGLWLYLMCRLNAHSDYEPAPDIRNRKVCGWMFLMAAGSLRHIHN